MQLVTILKLAIIVAVFGFMVWRMIHTRNWGKFDKASMIVWGSVVGVIALVALAMVIMSRRLASYLL